MVAGGRKRKFSPLLVLPVLLVALLLCAAVMITSKSPVEQSVSATGVTVEGAARTTPTPAPLENEPWGPSKSIPQTTRVAPRTTPPPPRSELEAPPLSISDQQGVAKMKRKRPPSRTDATRAPDVSPGDTRLSALAFVLTAPKAVVQRDAIRKTWAQLADPVKYRVTVRFAVGRVADQEVDEALRIEQEEHGDLHRTESDEGYLKISWKVLRFIVEAVEAGYTFDYIVKADDDTWLQMDVLMDELKGRPRERFYFGNIYTNNPRFKNPNDQWYEPNYFSDYYPSYATGGTGYILSQDLAKWIARNKDDMVVFTGNEDAMVGTWCAAHRGVPAVGDGRFIQLYGTDACMDVPLGVHLGPYPVKWPAGTLAAAMQDYYDNYKARGSVCPQEGNSDTRLIAMAEKRGDESWFRMASYATGHCLTTSNDEPIWRGCSQYDSEQVWQRWTLEKAGNGWRIKPKLSDGVCLAVGLSRWVAQQAVELQGCDGSDGQVWEEVPSATGMPGRMRHHSGLCIHKDADGEAPHLVNCDQA